MPDTDRTPNSSDAPTTDRLRRGVDHHDPATEPPATDGLLPALADGVTLLDAGDGGRRPLQALVLDHLLRRPGPAVWVDARGHVSPTALAGLAPSRRLLDRIRLVRGFTAHKHYAALRSLADVVTNSTGTSSRGVGARDDPSTTPAVLVAPAIDACYRGAETVGAESGRTLLARGLAGLVTYARRRDVPVLLTREADDAYGAVVAAAADHRLRCQQTDFGPRFVGDGVETLAYSVGNGAHRQTTLAYWRRLLNHRATHNDAAVDADTRSPGPSATDTAAPRATSGSTLTPSPLHDAHRIDVGPRGW